MARLRLAPESDGGEERTPTIVASGLFGDVEAAPLPVGHAEYDARSYARLVGTYSDHLALADDVRARLLDGIAALIDSASAAALHQALLADLYVAAGAYITRA